MSTLQIRDLPSDVREALAFRADRDHRSLAQQAVVELRQMPELRAATERLQVLAAIRRDLHESVDDDGIDWLGEAGDSALMPEVLIREDRER